jgi:high-affinity nickel-transport protein
MISLGKQGIFGVGIGLTAYTLGLRHAVDADHITAIDNTSAS